MLSGANLLVLDEPTNHLDVESIEALEDAIEAYDGTVILVSHDRALLRALTTRIWILHERRMTEFAGSFAEWEEVSKERAHAAAVSAAGEQGLRRPTPYADAAGLPDLAGSNVRIPADDDAFTAATAAGRAWKRCGPAPSPPLPGSPVNSRFCSVSPPRNSRSLGAPTPGGRRR